MGNNKICSVKSCPTGRKLKSREIDTSQPVSFFRPTTSAKLEMWNMALRTTMKKTDYICHLHFKETDIKMYEIFNIKGEISVLPTGRKTLRDGAVPTIEHQFIPIKPLHEPQASVMNTSQSNSNHNQSKDNQNNQVQQNQDKFGETEHHKEMPQLDQETHNDSPNDKESEVTSQSAEKFWANFKSSALPPSWLYLETPKGLEFIRVNVPTMQIQNRLRVNKDLTVSVLFSTGKEVIVNDNISTFNSISDYLNLVD